MKNLIEASFLRNAYFSYGAQGFRIVLGFAWMTTLTRVAGIEMYGIIALLTSLSGLAGNLLTFRTNEAVIRFYKRGEIEESPGLCRLAIEVGLLLDLAIAAMLGAGIQLYADTIASGLLKNPEATSGVVMYSWVILATFLRGTGIGLLTALERFRTIYSLEVFEQLLRLVILIVALQMGIALTVDNVVMIIFIPAFTVTTVILSLPIFKLFKFFGRVAIPAGELRNYARFSLSTFVSSSLKAGNRNIDTIILGYLTNPSNVGVYSLFQRFLRPLLSAVSPFYQQIYPKFVQAVSTSRSESIKFTITQTNASLFKWSSLLLFSISLIVAMYWSYMDFSFNAEHVLTFLFMAASTMLMQQLWWTRGFALSYKPNISIVANILSSILVVSLVSTFTWYIGLVGAALGILVATAVISLYWKSILRRYICNDGEIRK